MSKPFAVNLWGSKPGDNDDCWTGDEFDTLAEALEVYNNPLAHFKGNYTSDEELWVELDGFTDNDGNNLERRIYKPQADASHKGRNQDRGRREWQHEQAMEAGMLHGVEAYNEAMGYD